MPDNRYYINGPIEKSVMLDEAEHRHLSQVMRGKMGGHVELFNGQGILAQAEIVEVSKRETKLKVISSQTEPKPAELILAQAIPRINRLDMIIEKGTELGVTQFWLFLGERSERKTLTEHQIERLKHICIAASKQSGRLWLPTLEVLPSLDKWKKPTHPLIFGDLESDKTILDLPKQSSFILIIGPESGLSPNEIACIKKNNGQGVRFHKNILRTDTAAIVGLTLMPFAYKG